MIKSKSFRREEYSLTWFYSEPYHVDFGPGAPRRYHQFTEPASRWRNTRSEERA